MILILYMLLFIMAAGVGAFFAVRWIYNYFKKNMDMETVKSKFSQSLTFKAIIIVVLILVLLIPGKMIQNLIKERQERSHETVQKINDRWSGGQTLCAPLLLVPYVLTKYDRDNRPAYETHVLHITPKELKINAKLTPEERHYGIFKAILYKSNLHFEGNFSELAHLNMENCELLFDKAQIAIGISDLRGVTQNPDFKIGNTTLETTVGVVTPFNSGKTLIVNLKDIPPSDNLHFDCTMQLNGSSAISFVPIGQHTSVTVSGQWQSPSFIGGFSPESTVDKGQFDATWNILSFNREIPQMWSDNTVTNLEDHSFGVFLIETVDHYQQNMRSAKYALMFIALTFTVFFFVEIITKKPILVFQYVLVGIALILFYSLLLSLSEQIGFGWSYLVASAATILLITVYFYSLIKQKPATFILAGIMFILYAFLYIILQLEDLALLFGSIFLFVILGVIMFVSNKIKLGKPTHVDEIV